MFIYLHGFNSAFNPESEKIAELSKVDEVVGFNYDSFANAFDIFDDLEKQFRLLRESKSESEFVFVGTSLGGFWAAQLANHFGEPSIIINPSVNPYLGLAKYVGVRLKNYQTSEERILTQLEVDSYKDGHLDFHSIPRYKLVPLLLLDMGDEVIDSAETARLLEPLPKVEFQGGSHRFDHIKEAIPNIKQYLNHCSFVEHMDF